MQGVFSRTYKQVIMDWISAIDERHLLVGQEEEEKVSSKKAPSRLVAKNGVKEVDQGSEKTESSFKFNDIFDVDYSTPMRVIHKKLILTRITKY